MASLWPSLCIEACNQHARICLAFHPMGPWSCAAAVSQKLKDDDKEDGKPGKKKVARIVIKTQNKKYVWS